MQYYSEYIGGSILQSMPKYIEPKSRRPYTLQKLGSKPLGNSMMHPLSSTPTQFFFPSSCDVFPDGSNNQLHMYQKLGENQHINLRTTETVYTQRLRPYCGLYSDYNAKCFARSPFVKRVAHRQQAKYPSYKPSCTYAIVYRRDLKLPNDFRCMRGHPESFPQHPSNLIGRELVSESIKGKLGSSCSHFSSQEQRQRYSMDPNFSKNCKEECLSVMCTLQSEVGVLGSRTNKINLDAKRYSSMEINEFSRNIVGVNERRSAKVDREAKAKYGQGKRLVQCLFGVSDGQIGNIAKVDDEERRNYWNWKGDYNESLGHPQSEHTRIAGRFQLRNLTYGRQKPRNNRERWVTVSALCNSLETMCRKNSFLRPMRKPFDDTRYDTKNVSGISLADYLKRIALFLDCSTECFVIALEFIKQIVIAKPEVNVNYSTVRQLIVAAIRVSNKLVDDE
jgi:hypothetical protein